MTPIFCVGAGKSCDYPTRNQPDPIRETPIRPVRAGIPEDLYETPFTQQWAGWANYMYVVIQRFDSRGLQGDCLSD